MRFLRRGQSNASALVNIHRVKDPTDVKKEQPRSSDMKKEQPRSSDMKKDQPRSCGKKDKPKIGKESPISTGKKDGILKKESTKKHVQKKRDQSVPDVRRGNFILQNEKSEFDIRRGDFILQKGKSVPDVREGDFLFQNKSVFSLPKEKSEPKVERKIFILNKGKSVPDVREGDLTVQKDKPKLNLQKEKTEIRVKRKISIFNKGKSVPDVRGVPVDVTSQKEKPELNLQKEKPETPVKKKISILNKGKSAPDVRKKDLGQMTRKERKNEKAIGISFRDVTGAKKPVTVTRSKSFAGMSTSSGSQPSTPILGETLRHSPRSTLNSRSGHSVKSLGASVRKTNIKIPKVPRPHRALIMFESVKRGIREFVQATQNDVAQLQTKQADSSISQGKLLELDKQVKAAERYLKRLEFHLTKLEELQEYYMIQQQLREGVRTMAQAYVTSPGKRKESLTNVKFGYKECSQTMCAIEAQLESMLGVLHCKLQGMAGFARICPGDVFQVTLCYGAQKWKSRGKMEKDGTQRWDVPHFAFKALVGDVISIKGVEVRSFKSVVLGQKCCETRDLFSANPQLMTVNINTNGSLKLSVIVTWNPLEGVDDTLSFYEVPSRPQTTPRSRPVSMLALNGDHLSTSDWELGPDRRYSSGTSFHKPYDDQDSLYGSHKVLSPSPLTNSPVFVKDSKSYIMPNRTSLPPDIVRTSLPTTTLPPPLLSQSQASGGYGQVTVSRDDPNNLEDALNNLSSTLEDFQGQYSELQKLEEVVVTLEHMLRRHSRCSSRSSIISVSIESALEAFDFLNTEEETTDELELPPSSPDHSKSSSLDLMMASPESTAKTADSGIESLAKRLSEDTNLGSSMGSSPIPPTTGNDQVDQALLFHLSYCEKLLDNLGNFGPLRCREIYALDKLQQQSDTLESLIKIAKSGSDIDLHEVLTELTSDKQLREFWVKCVDHNILYVQPEKLLAVFEQKFASKIQEKYEIKSEREKQYDTSNTIFLHIISRILDIPSFDQDKYKPTNVITVFQLMHYFKDVGGLKAIDIVSEELYLSDRLCSGNPDITIKAILQLRGTLPSTACLKVIGTLMVSANREIRQSAGSYIKLIMKRSETREAAVVIFVEGLEDKTADIRSGSCVALSILEATESIDQLVYLCQTDVSAAVRSKAKETLYSFGEDGRKAFEEANLASHGFQGIQMKRK